MEMYYAKIDDNNEIISIIKTNSEIKQDNYVKLSENKAKEIINKLSTGKYVAKVTSNNKVIFKRSDKDKSPKKFVKLVGKVISQRECLSRLYQTSFIQELKISLSNYYNRENELYNVALSVYNNEDVVCSEYTELELIYIYLLIEDFIIIDILNKTIKSSNKVDNKINILRQICKCLEEYNV